MTFLSLSYIRMLRWEGNEYGQAKLLSEDEIGCVYPKPNGNVFVSVYLFKGAAESEKCIQSMSVSAQVCTECSGTYVKWSSK